MRNKQVKTQQAGHGNWAVCMELKHHDFFGGELIKRKNYHKSGITISVTKNTQATTPREIVV